MTVPAQAPPGLRQLLCESDPAALATLKACRFCGGSDLLGYQYSYGDWSAYEGDELKTDASGEVVFESYDAVECTSCCVTAPYVVWQSDGDVFAGRKRQAYVAYAREVGIIQPDPLRLARAH